MSFQIQWSVPPEQAFSELAADYARRVEAGIVDIAEHYAPMIAADLKHTHPWKNRTGDAEAGLHTEVNHIVNQMVDIILAHGVDYGIWLETKFAGRDSVLLPNLDVWSVRIWQDVVAMLR